MTFTDNTWHLGTEYDPSVYDPFCDGGTVVRLYDPSPDCASVEIVINIKEEKEKMEMVRLNRELRKLA